MPAAFIPAPRCLVYEYGGGGQAARVAVFSLGPRGSAGRTDPISVSAGGPRAL